MQLEGSVGGLQRGLFQELRIPRADRHPGHVLRMRFLCYMGEQAEEEGFARRCYIGGVLFPGAEEARVVQDVKVYSSAARRRENFYLFLSSSAISRTVQRDLVEIPPLPPLD